VEIATRPPAEASNVIAGEIVFVNYLGSQVSYRVKTAGGVHFQVLKPLLGELPPFEEGSPVALWWAADRGKVVA
jgi:hypothetical protein